jgi:hypothetical protein
MESLRFSFVAYGLQNITALPAAVRADYHDLAADILSEGGTPEEIDAAHAAMAVAKALRESEAAQMRLGLLLSTNAQ